MESVISPVNIDSRKKLDLRAGDTVRVHQKIEEKGKTRIQVFEGLVLSRKHGTEAGATFTVRRSTGGYGVEKIYPLYSPMIDKIEITKRSKVRRGKLYYIRRKALKQIKKRMKMTFIDISDEVKEEPEPETKDEETPKDNDDNENAVIDESLAEEMEEKAEEKEEDTPKEEEKEEEKEELKTEGEKPAEEEKKKEE